METNEHLWSIHKDIDIAVCKKNSKTGNTTFHATLQNSSTGYVYAPYIPLYTTPVFTTDVGIKNTWKEKILNLFIKNDTTKLSKTTRKILERYSKKSVNVSHYSQIKIM